MAEKEITAAEALQKVKEAERTARTIVEETKEKEVPLILAEAREKAKAVVEEILRKAKEEAEKRKQVIMVQAKEEAERIKKDTQIELTRLEEKAKERFAAAWPIILSQIRRELKGGKE